MRKIGILIFVCLFILFISNTESQEYEAKDSSQLFPINQNGKYGYIDKNGKVIVTPQFDYARSMSEGMAAISKDDKYGYINATGQLVIAAKFNSYTVGDFHDGLARASNDGGSKWGYIDKTGEFVIEPRFDRAEDFSEGIAAVNIGGQISVMSNWIGGQWSYINKNGTKVRETTDNQHWRKFHEGMKIIKKEDEWLYGFTNRKGEIIIEPRFSAVQDFSEGVAGVCLKGLNDKCGFINKKGNYIIEPSFDWVGIFNEGLANVKIRDQNYFINKKGKIVIEVSFDHVGSFSEGLAWVNNGRKESMLGDGTPIVDDYGKCGFIDRTGRLIIPLQFDHAYNFSGGVAKIRIKKNWGYIDKGGNYIWEPSN